MKSTRDITFEKLMNEPLYQELRDMIIPSVNTLVAMDEKTFSVLVFKYLDELEPDATRFLCFILLILLRQHCADARLN